MRRLVIIAALALAATLPQSTEADVSTFWAQITAIPVVLPAGAQSTWVASIHGPWVNAQVDIVIPAILADVTVTPLDGSITCTDISDQTAYKLRCAAQTAPTSVTIRGRVLVAPAPFCATVTAYGGGELMAGDSDCQIVTGLHRYYAPVVAH